MRILRRSARFFVTVAAAALLSACSSSLERFSSANAEDYVNPSDSDPVYTAAIKKPRKKAAAVRDTYKAPEEEPLVEEPIVSKPLASVGAKKPKLAYDYSDSYSKKPQYKQKPKLALNDEVEREPAYSEPVADDTVEPAPKKLKKPVPIAKSGRVRVEPGMTMYSIARANGVSVDELAAVNGLKKPYWVSAGTVLLLPGVAAPVVPKSTLQAQKKQIEEEQGASLAEEETVESPAKKISKAGASAHVVEGGDTLYSLGRKYGVSPFAIAEANDLSRDATLVLGQKVKIPAGGKIAAIKKEPKIVVERDVENISDEEPQVFTKPKKIIKEAEVAEQPAESEEKVASAEPVSPKVPKIKEAAPVATPEALAMRWPVRGKVISEYGPKSNGMKNEGINISVPEGTSVRAAETGVVAYAGSELKGYGNLILIRHAGGYVTAYAHAKELVVKRGDKVKRGDVIAKAGQTGAVSSPQLHFEVRKGAAALDPQKFLGSSTAMN